MAPGPKSPTGAFTVGEITKTLMEDYQATVRPAANSAVAAA